jgi:acetyl esterase/lipase
LLDHIDGHERHFFIWYLQGARRLPRRPFNLSEAFAVPQSDCYPIAKRSQKIVFSFVVLVADPAIACGYAGCLEKAGVPVSFRPGLGLIHDFIRARAVWEAAQAGYLAMTRWLRAASG